MPSSSPHDALFKRAFEDLEEAAALLQNELPADIARRIDWGRLERVPGTFVDEHLSERRTDLLFRCPLEGHELLIYLLLEHQSSETPLMVFRVLRYMLRIWDRWLLDHPNARKLPVIVPIVVFHGTEAWTAPSSTSAPSRSSEASP